MHEISQKTKLDGPGLTENGRGCEGSRGKAFPKGGILLKLKTTACCSLSQSSIGSAGHCRQVVESQPVKCCSHAGGSTCHSRSLKSWLMQRLMPGSRRLAQAGLEDRSQRDQNCLSSSIVFSDTSNCFNLKVFSRFSDVPERLPAVDSRCILGNARSLQSC